jgi:hypothetical protein
VKGGVPPVKATFQVLDAPTVVSPKDVVVIEGFGCVAPEARTCNPK